MSISLKNACFDIWKKNYERKGINTSFKPLFVRYIGVENINEYNDILKTFTQKFEENKEISFYFDCNIPFEAEFDIINYVSGELQTMDISQLKNQDIVLFDDININKMFLESLDTIVNLAIKQENFFNESIRNNFILKLIVWSYLYLKNIKFEDNMNPKCLYYGDITKHEIYFLMMLNLMTFDVIFINPLRDELWNELDFYKLSELHKNNQIVNLETLKNKIAQGTILNYNESISLQLEREVQNEFLNNTGIFRPWQYRNSNIKSVFIKSTLIDLVNNYTEPSRVRNGFDIKDNLVYIPNYFYQIDGEYKNKQEYKKLVNLFINTENTLVLNDKGESLITKKISKEEKLKLTFCLLNDMTFDINELKKLDFYSWSNYNEIVQNFLLTKINDLMKDLNIYNQSFNNNEIYDLITDILNINHNIIKMIDNFDFTNNIPKLVLFLENEDFISKEIQFILGFLNVIGFDVIILNPSGLKSIDQTINNSRFNYIRLENMQYNEVLSNIKAKEIKGFFEKLKKEIGLN